MMYVPEGCGHGFLTLEDNTEVLYQMTEFYNAESAQELYDAYEALRVRSGL
jgi:dTDP-4-dehydrorhamnose 3,5-epimerase